MKQKTIFLVGADTGGHVVPVFALAEKLLAKGFLVVVIGIGSEIEKKFYCQDKRIEYKIISAGKLRKSSFFSNIVSVFKTLVAFCQSFYLIIKYKPGAVFLNGGYATLPVAYAARILRLKIFAHESDAIIGRSNRIISHFARNLFLSYPLAVYQGKIKNGLYSGPILRSQFETPAKNRSEDYDKFGFKVGTKTILVIGGSLGAHSINQAVFGCLEKLLSNYQILHQTGVVDFQNAKEAKKSLAEKTGNRYFITDFFQDEIYQAIAIADLVVSRSGSMIMELAATKKPTILIPYPYASLDHQEANGKYFQEKSAVVLINDKNLSPTILYSTISKIISSDKKLEELAGNLHKSIKADGLDVVFHKLIES